MAKILLRTKTSGSLSAGDFTTREIIYEQARGCIGVLGTDSALDLFMPVNDSGAANATDVTWTPNKITGYVKSLVNGLDWQESVKSLLSAPPVSPSDGDRYIVRATGTGAWAGKENHIMQWDSLASAWTDITPDIHSTLVVEGGSYFSGQRITWNASAWVQSGGEVSHNQMADLQGGSSTERYHLAAAPSVFANAMDQSVITTGTPQFARAGLGGAAHATIPLSAKPASGTNQIRLINTGNTYALNVAVATITTADKTATFQNKTGTVALTSDITGDSGLGIANLISTTYQVGGIRLSPADSAKDVLLLKAATKPNANVRIFGVDITDDVAVGLSYGNYGGAVRLKYLDGNQAANAVLTSDANGVATWSGTIDGGTYS